MRLASLHVYPIKGARAVGLARSDVLASGLRHDRRFMVVDAAGTFVSQRTHPRLALVGAEIRGETLALTTDAGATEIPLAPRDGARRRVRIWDDECEAIVIEGDAPRLLSEHLGAPSSLVYMPDDVVRPVEAPHGRAGDRVGFADAYPVLLASLASLADLNARLDEPVPMTRFRPNLVVAGGDAYDEDRFDAIRVGALTFRMPKRCSRCQVTTVDQATAAVGKEPLRTLARHRTEGNKVYFGQNLIPDSEGVVAVGDRVVYGRG